MALRITDDCTSCGDCQPVCPVKAIYEGQGKYEIDPSKCNECVGWADSPLCVEVCTVGSIVTE